MKDYTRTELHELIDHLEAEGYLKSEGEKSPLILTESAKEVLYRGKTVTMLVRRETEVRQKEEKKLGGKDADLFDVLKELRSSLAKESGVPPFVIFSNATLTDMAKKKPTNLTAFKKVSGVGEIKAAWYGKAFVSRIKAYLDEQNQ